MLENRTTGGPPFAWGPSKPRRLDTTIAWGLIRLHPFILDKSVSLYSRGAARHRHPRRKETSVVDSGLHETTIWCPDIRGHSRATVEASTTRGSGESRGLRDGGGRQSGRGREARGRPSGRGGRGSRAASGSWSDEALDRLISSD